MTSLPHPTTLPQEYLRDSDAILARALMKLANGTDEVVASLRTIASWTAAEGMAFGQRLRRTIASFVHRRLMTITPGSARRDPSRIRLTEAGISLCRRCAVVVPRHTKYVEYNGTWYY